MALKLKDKKTIGRKGRRIVLTGPGGVGKSTAAGIIAKKPLVFNLEDRWPEELVEKSDFLDGIETFKEVRDGLESVLAEDKLTNDFLVIDTGTKVMAAVEQWTIAKNCEGEKARYNDFGFGLKFSPQYFQELLDLLNAIQKKHDIHILVICHTKIKTIQNPLGKDYSKFVLDLPDSVADKLFQWADLVGYAYQDVKVDESGMKKKAAGPAPRVISFTDSPQYTAKNGTPVSLPEKLAFDKEGKWAEVVLGNTKAELEALDKLIQDYPAKKRPELEALIEHGNIRGMSASDLRAFVAEGREQLKQLGVK